MEEAFRALLKDTRDAHRFEAILAARSTTRARKSSKQSGDASDDGAAVHQAAVESSKRVAAVVRRKREHSEKQEAQQRVLDCDDAALSRVARFTDHLALQPYASLLKYVPRVVNVARASVDMRARGCGCGCASATLAPARDTFFLRKESMRRCGGDRRSRWRKLYLHLGRDSPCR